MNKKIIEVSVILMMIITIIMLGKINIINTEKLSTKREDIKITTEKEKELYKDYDEFINDKSYIKIYDNKEGIKIYLGDKEFTINKQSKIVSQIKKILTK